MVKKQVQIEKDYSALSKDFENSIACKKASGPRTRF